MLEILLTVGIGTVAIILMLIAWVWLVELCRGETWAVAVACVIMFFLFAWLMGDWIESL